MGDEVLQCGGRAMVRAASRRCFLSVGKCGVGWGGGGVFMLWAFSREESKGWGGCLPYPMHISMIPVWLSIILYQSTFQLLSSNPIIAQYTSHTE